MDPSKEIAGGFYSLQGAPPPNLPMRPPGQAGPVPPGPAPNYYVDQVENKYAHLVDEKGNAIDVPATPGMREGRNLDGSLPSNDGYDLRLKLGRGDDGRDIDLNAPLPPVPLAPGSPGPPVPPAADSMIGRKKTSSQTKRRRIP